MSVLYVASEQPGAGKTALTATLASLLTQSGTSVAVFKPFTAAETGDDPDLESYRELLGQEAEGWPVQLSSGGLTPDALGNIKAALDGVASGRDAVVVEGSAAVPDSDLAALLETLDARAVVVLEHRPDLDAKSLEAWSQRCGGRLLGFLVNNVPLYRMHDVQTRLLPELGSGGTPSLGAIPEDRTLLGVTVAQLADHLEGRFLSQDGDPGALVEHIMIGCLTRDPGELYFGLYDDKAVVVRGDRPDIQLACLVTPTACLVLTGGKEPIEYVIYEAQERNVAIIVVEADTLATMDSLGGAIGRARFDHPAKLARFGQLLEEHADLPALYTGLGVSA